MRLTLLMTSVRESVKHVLAIAGMALLVGQAWSAPAISVSNVTGAGGLGNPPFTLGFSFTANSNITVTSLGLFDGNADGLTTSHSVGLWNSAGTLLTSGALSAGSVNSLVGNFRYVDVADVDLVTGETYTVGALFTTDTEDLIFPGGATGFATAAEITFGDARFIDGSALANPTNSSGPDAGYFGPNFLFDGAATPVPEPGTVALLGLGLVGLAAMRRRTQA